MRNNRTIAASSPAQDAAGDFWPGVVEALQAISHTIANPLSPTAPGWKAEQYALGAGEGAQLVTRNPTRIRGVITADPANSGPLFISPAPISGDTAPGAGSGTVAIAPGGEHKFHHPGDVYAWADADAVAHVHEEYAAGRP